MLVSGGHTWASVSGGTHSACGITTANDAYCWGGGSDGQLGNGLTQDSATPVLVSGGHTWASIEGGRGNFCGVTTTGEAYCWGRNDHGQLGDGTTTNHSLPAQVLKPS